MEVSCENYNQCQLTQPDLTPHTVRCNSSPSWAHTNTHTHIMEERSFPIRFIFFFPPSSSVFTSHPHCVCVCHTHTHTHVCRFKLGCVAVSDQSHSQQKESGQRGCHSTFSTWTLWRSCQHRNGRTCICLCDSGCDSPIKKKNVCVSVYVCTCAFLAFYLGIASEQFKACHSICRTGSKSERQLKLGLQEKERRWTIQQEGEKERLAIRSKRRTVRGSEGGQVKEKERWWYTESSTGSLLLWVCRLGQPAGAVGMQLGTLSLGPYGSPRVHTAFPQRAEVEGKEECVWSEKKKCLCVAAASSEMPALLHISVYGLIAQSCYCSEGPFAVTLA